MIIPQLFPAIVSPGQCVIDIGAFRGDITTLPLSQAVGPSGRVHAFECQPMHFFALAEMAFRSPNQNIFPYLRAMSDRRGHAPLGVDTTPISQASTIMPYATTAARLGTGFLSLKIETETIDEFCRQAEVKPDFIKIDAEGADGLVLRGGIRTVEKYLPALLLELGVNQPSDLPAHPFLLEELGYRLFLAEIMFFKGRWMADTETMKIFPMSSHEIPAMGPIGLNYLAIHESKLRRDHPVIASATALEYLQSIP